MTQSLSGIDSVKSECCEIASPDFPGVGESAALFAPSLDLAAAERFQAVIADESSGFGFQAVIADKSSSFGFPADALKAADPALQFFKETESAPQSSAAAGPAPQSSEETAPAPRFFAAAGECREGERPREPETFSEHIQIIAPTPLPIESSVIYRQAAVPVPSEINRMFVAAAEAVADAMLVSSGFKDGEGRMIIRLRPEVLKGSEVHINAKGGTLTIVVNPATQEVQNVVEANRTQFEQHLAEKIHSWRIVVAVRRGVKLNERI